MTLEELTHLIGCDLYRYAGKRGFKTFWAVFLEEPGFKYICWMRVAGYCKASRIRKILFFWWVRAVLRHYTYKFGISIPCDTKIGSGLYIVHFGGITVNKRVVIGKNCNLLQGVTLGQSNRGDRRGSPVIGDNVFLGAGAKIFGEIKIGNNAAIGANCVVTKDVPENSVVVGIPGRVISLNGSRGYINRTDY